MRSLGQSARERGGDDLGGNGGAPWSSSSENDRLSSTAQRGRHYSQNRSAQTFLWVKGRFVRGDFAWEPIEPTPSLTRGAYRRRRFHGLIGALAGSPWISTRAGSARAIWSVRRPAVESGFSPFLEKFQASNNSAFFCYLRKDFMAGPMLLCAVLNIWQLCVVWCRETSRGSCS